MGRKNKLKRFAELSTFPNVYQNFNFHNPVLTGANNESVVIKGRWGQQHFRNTRPIILELACGKAEFALAMARNHPEINFIGVDVKGARIWKGASTALKNGLGNLAFLRTRIENLDKFFGKGEILEIWITFPDPFLKKGKDNRRLTCPNFLDLYRQIIGNKAMIHLKTDSVDFFNYSFETICNYPFTKLLYSNPSIYKTKFLYSELAYRTYYENKHLKSGKTIKYMRFELSGW